MAKIKLVVPTEPDPETVLEDASDWVSGALRGIADRLVMCRLRNEPPTEWTCDALCLLADAAEGAKPPQVAIQLARYVAVREAHDREGLTWEAAKDRAVEMLRGQPAEAKRDTMWTAYKKVREAMRAAYKKKHGTDMPDDDPGYRWIDPNKTPE
jgi:hypothetical protein